MAKIYCIITQADDNTLSASTLDLPAEYSADIKMQFVKNSNYSGYAVTPYFAVGYGTSVTVKTLTIDSDSCFVLPAEAFKQDAMLSIAFALSDTSETIQTEPISFDIKASIGGTSVLPSDDPTWQQIVSSFLNSLMSSGMITTSYLQDGCVTANKIATVASQSIALGNGALSTNTGNYNVAVGYKSMNSNTTGSSNVGIGNTSLYANTTGNLNVALGKETLYFNTTGSSNMGIGYRTLYENTSGSYNTSIGINSLASNTTGTNNIAIGTGAARYITDGTTKNSMTSNSIFIGSDTRSKTISDGNTIVIGYNAKGNGSNTTSIGNTSTTDSYIAGALHVGSIPSVALTGINVGTYSFAEGIEYIVDSTSTNVPLTGVSYIVKKIGTLVVAIMTSGSYIGWTFFATYGSITSSSSWTSPFIVQ